MSGLLRQYERTCWTCGRSFTTSAPQKETCSEACHDLYLAFAGLFLHRLEGRGRAQKRGASVWDAWLDTLPRDRNGRLTAEGRAATLRLRGRFFGGLNDYHLHDRRFRRPIALAGASAEDLLCLWGVGAVLAGRILDWLGQVGAELDGRGVGLLREVRGIGPVVMRRNQSRLRVREEREPAGGGA